MKKFKEERSEKRIVVVEVNTKMIMIYVRVESLKRNLWVGVYTY